MLVKLTVPLPVPDASIVALLVPAVAVPIVNRRSVVWAAEPVYWRIADVPDDVPPKTRLVAALLDAPMLLFEPPLAREARLRVPPVIEVTPV